MHAHLTESLLGRLRSGVRRSNRRGAPPRRSRGSTCPTITFPAPEGRPRGFRPGKSPCPRPDVAPPGLHLKFIVPPCPHGCAVGYLMPPLRGSGSTSGFAVPRRSRGSGVSTSLEPQANPTQCGLPPQWVERTVPRPTLPIGSLLIPSPLSTPSCALRWFGDLPSSGYIPRAVVGSEDCPVGPQHFAVVCGRTAKLENGFSGCYAICSISITAR